MRSRMNVATMMAVAATLGMHAGTTPDDTMVLRAGNDEPDDVHWGADPAPGPDRTVALGLPAWRGPVGRNDPRSAGPRNFEIGAKERARRERKAGAA